MSPEHDEIRMESDDGSVSPPAAIDGMPTTEALRDALREVPDPELGIGIVDLGLVADLRVMPGRIELDLLMTSPACPMGDLLMSDSADALEQAAPPGCEIDVQLVDEPVWTPERMSPSTRLRFGW